MKKTSLFLLISLFVSSCSATVDQLFLIPTITPTPSSTATTAPTDIPTFTPTVATLTFTPTPTLIGQLTPSATLESTATEEATNTPLPIFTPPTPTPPNVDLKGFVNVFTSVKEFYKPGVCDPQTVKFTAQAKDAGRTAFVVLFVRFKSKVTSTTSAWTSITMKSLVPGTFVYDLTADDMKAVDSFENAWVEYQFVATDSKTHEIGRTAIVSDSLTLSNCNPTPTPITSPTSTVLKP